MTRGQRAATWGRRALLATGVLLLVAGLFWMVAPLLYGPEVIPGLMGVIGFYAESESLYSAVLAVYLGLFICTQWLFLRPRRQWTMRATLRGRPMKRSIFSAALIASILSVGLMATLLEIPGWWRYVVATNWAADQRLTVGAVESVSAGGVTVHPAPPPPALDIDDVDFRVWPGLLAIGVAWSVWALIFWRYWRSGDRYTQFTRMIRGLLVGSILEVFVATAVHAFTYRRDECHCCRGSYTGLVFGGTALLWVFGPGIVLLYKRERYRQRVLLPTCIECGYDLRGIAAAKCPECGEAIPEEVANRMRDSQSEARRCGERLTVAGEGAPFG
ncbi:MAG: hypothetical protein KJZ69_14060 [Phycisphaerales bacterium]|nr:hypothetical protein [Phycisphaerales bacterium]